MKKYLSLLVLALVAYGVASFGGRNEVATSQNQENSISQTSINDEEGSFEMPAPLSDRAEQIVAHTGYTLSYNKDNNTPNWSAWQLTDEKTRGTIERSSKFFADPKISQLYRVDYFDYKGSGYDRGHMCPAGDMKWSETAMHDCFYMSNMCPQEHALNNGAWKKLEEACRTWATNEGKIYIVCGPVYKGNRHEQIGINHAINVPEGFFKAVLSLRQGHQKAIGFYYDNSTCRQSMAKAAMSVDQLEELTGIDFFYQLDDKIEEKLESSYSINDWQ